MICYGGWTRTIGLQRMRLMSYQLLHSVILGNPTAFIKIPHPYTIAPNEWT